MKSIRLFTLPSVLVAGLALGATLAPDTPLIEDNGVGVTALDFEAAIARVPEERRTEARASHERVMTMLDSVYVSRQVAAKARAAGMDKDPVVQRRLEQAQDSLLTEIYLQSVEKAAKIPDLEQRARELYKADSDKYKTEESVYIQHLLVGLNGRTPAMALERAKELRKELDDSKEDFLVMAKRVSEDPDKRRNGGDLGWYSTKSLEAPLVEASRTMKKGEISQPIETKYGYHIIRFIDRKPSEPVPFEAVKSKIMKAERERLAKEKVEAVIKEVRDSKTVIVHRDNIEALRSNLDMGQTSRDAAAAIKAGR